jgi:hypothetical protein
VKADHVRQVDVAAAGAMTAGLAQALRQDGGGFGYERNTSTNTAPPVLAEQALDDVGALDAGGHIGRLAGFVQRRSLFPRLVRPMPVIYRCARAAPASRTTGP